MSQIYLDNDVMVRLLKYIVRETEVADPNERDMDAEVDNIVSEFLHKEGY